MSIKKYNKNRYILESSYFKYKRFSIILHNFHFGKSSIINKKHKLSSNLYTLYTKYSTSKYGVHTQMNKHNSIYE